MAVVSAVKQPITYLLTYLPAANSPLADSNATVLLHYSHSSIHCDMMIAMVHWRPQQVNFVASFFATLRSLALHEPRGGTHATSAVTRQTDGRTDRPTDTLTLSLSLFSMPSQCAADGCNGR